MMTASVLYPYCLCTTATVRQCYSLPLICIFSEGRKLKFYFTFITIQKNKDLDDKNVSFFFEKCAVFVDCVIFY